jgi:hypothetical protein
LPAINAANRFIFGQRFLLFCETTILIR